MSTEITIANAFIQRAFQRQNEKLDVISGTNDGEHLNINLSSIIDTLMHNVGRFCEAHLGDFLITWHSLMNSIKETTPGEEIIAFGIRQHGVDSNLFLYSRCLDHKQIPSYASTFYRKIFAVKIKREVTPTIYGQTPDDIMCITVVLKDISDCVWASDFNEI